LLSAPWYAIYATSADAVGAVFNQEARGGDFEVELDVNALQVLQEVDREVGLFPCAETCQTWLVTCNNTGP